MPTIEEAKKWYAHADPVHDFEHVMRVYRMAERLGEEEGADLEILRAAALLHDVEGSVPGGEEGNRANHHQSSASFAGQVLQAEGWPEDRIQAVQHCIRSHRYRDRSEPPTTLEAKILFDADKLDVLGAIGAARAIAYGAQAGQPIFAEPSEQFLRTGVEEPGEPHSPYHEFLFKLRHVQERLFTKTAQSIARERSQYLEEFFQRMQAEIAGEI